MQNRPNSLYETLTAAQALIADRDRWTRDTYARDSNGKKVSSLVEGACQFCTLGALHRVLGDENEDTDLYYKCKDLLAQATGYPDIDIPEYNDDRDTSHADIMAMFDKARELANVPAL